MTWPPITTIVAWLLLGLAAHGAEPGVFSITDFGARPGVDSRAAIQAALDAAATYAGSASLRSAIVTIPLQTFLVTGPLYRDAERVAIVGGGIGSVIGNKPGYGGPVLVEGINRLTRSEAMSRRRPAIVLDATARENRQALATKGTHILVVNEHPLQLGGPPPGAKGLRADYFQQDHYTLECCLVRPSGAVWADGVVLFGAMKGNEPSPYILCKTDNGFKLVLTAADGTTETAFVATPGLPRGAVDRGPWRLCFQIDRKNGRCWAWINDRAVAVSVTMRPNVKLKAPDGAHAWTFGSARGDIPGNDGPVVNVELHGFMISSGARYVEGKPRQVRVDGTPVTDATRYFTPTTGAVQTAAWFPLDDPGGTQVRLGSSWSSGTGFWIAAKRVARTGSLAMRDVTVYSGEQAAILLGDCWGSRYTRVRAGDSGSFAGLASIGVLSYPVDLDECDFYGVETGCYLYQSIGHIRNCRLSEVGRTGFFFCGGAVTLEGTFVSSLGPTCESILYFTGMGGGSTFRVIDSLFDNESAAPRDTAIRYDQVPNATNRLVIDGLDVAVPGAHGLIWLVGSGLDADPWKPTGAQWSPLKLEIRNVGRTTGQAPILRIDGPPGWVHGTFDASEQPTETVLGQPGPKLRVIPPAYPAKK